MNEIIKKIKLYRRFGRIKYLKCERSYIKNRDENTNLKFLFRSIGISLILFILIMLLPFKKCVFMYLTGVKNKLELLTFIGWGMSGILAFFGVIGLIQRVAALDKQNRIAEKAHVYERHKTATDRLSSENVSVRIAAFNDFYYLASIEQTLQKIIFDTLCNHLLQTIKDKNYQKDIDPSEEIKPTDEVENLLNVLFKPFQDNLIFHGLNAGLKGINLQGALLQNADLQGANLQNADLQKAYLVGANLKKAYLPLANLKEAILYKANLQMASLVEAKMQKAYLVEASMQEANLKEANLKEASLHRANLQNANLESANLQNAILQNAILQNAFLYKVNLQNADMEYAELQKANLYGANLQQVNLRDAKLQKAKLQEANLQEAELQEANLQGAKLQHANLQNVKLWLTDLQGANLKEANLQGAELQEANLQRVNLQGAYLQDADLQRAKIDKSTIMPDGWKHIVKKDNDGKTGVLLIDDEGKVIEYL